MHLRLLVCSHFLLHSYNYNEDSGGRGMSKANQKSMTPSRGRFVLARQVGEFVETLYQASLEVDSDAYKAWALGELARLIRCDAAIASIGNISKARYHSCVTLGLRDNAVGYLQTYADKNPFLPLLLENLGTPVMSGEAMQDEAFYGSWFYKNVFQPFGVERILGIAFVDESNGLYSQLSLYRNSREDAFARQEQELFGLLAPLYFSACSYRFFFDQRMDANGSPHEAFAALSDADGTIHDADKEFGNTLLWHFPGWSGSHLPPEIRSMLKKKKSSSVFGELVVSIRPYGELFVVTVRKVHPIDILTNREQHVVALAIKGYSYKDAARALKIAPSTVATMLSRAYMKLGISGRAELVKLLES